MTRSLLLYLMVFHFMHVQLAAQQAPMYPLFTTNGFGSTILDIDIDRDGFIYITGQSRLAPNFCVQNLQTKNSGNCYVAKLDPLGNVIWHTSVGNSDTRTTGVAVDGLGNVVVVGYFKGQVEINPGAANFYLTSLGYEDMFVLKLKPDGKFAWAVSAGQDSDDRANDVACDSVGNIFVTGFFKWIVDFNPGTGVNTLQSSLYGHNPFVWELNSSGGFVSAGKINTYLDGEGAKIALNGNNRPCITGYVVPTNRREPFVSAPGFYRQFRGSDNAQAVGIAVDSKNNVIISGWFGGTMDFDPGPDSVKFTAPGTWLADGFVLKLSSTGQYKWAYPLGSGNGYDTANDLAIDSLDRVFAVGRFRATVDFDPGPGTFSMTSPNVDGSDVFIQRVDSMGAFQWAGHFGFTGFSEDEGWAAAVSPKGYAYAGAQVWGSGYSGTLAGFAPCEVTRKTEQVKACDSVVYNGTTYTSSCKLIYAVLGLGCDTIISVQVEINKTPLASLTETGGVLTAPGGLGYGYQWAHCDSSYVLIPGETSPSFSPLTSGNYAVIMTQYDLCPDTSQCIWVNKGTSSINDAQSQQLEVWPNPTTGVVHILTEKNIFQELQIVNQSGQYLGKNQMKQGQNSFDISVYPDGLYFLHFKGEHGSAVRKIWKQN